jgi:hypothetical protein
MRSDAADSAPSVASKRAAAIFDDLTAPDDGAKNSTRIRQKVDKKSDGNHLAKPSNLGRTPR